MQFLSAFLFAFSSSCDSVIVGLSYGTKDIKINHLNCFIVALISGIGTFLSMAFGKLFLRIIPVYFANLFGSAILILFGIYLLIAFIRKNHAKKHLAKEDIQDLRHYGYTLQHPEIIDKDNSKEIEFKETIILGLILCFNNVGLGIGASITGLNIYLTSIASFVVCYIFLRIGHYLGKRMLSDKLSRYAEFISIFLILVLGIYELFL
jgi:putative sporulation protein YtaF